MIRYRRDHLKSHGWISEAGCIARKGLAETAETGRILLLLFLLLTADATDSRPGSIASRRQPPRQAESTTSRPTPSPVQHTSGLPSQGLYGIRSVHEVQYNRTTGPSNDIEAIFLQALAAGKGNIRVQSIVESSVCRAEEAVRAEASAEVEASWVKGEEAAAEAKDKTEKAAGTEQAPGCEGGWILTARDTGNLLGRAPGGSSGTNKKGTVHAPGCEGGWTLTDRDTGHLLGRAPNETISEMPKFRWAVHNLLSLVQPGRIAEMKLHIRLQDPNADLKQIAVFRAYTESPSKTLRPMLSEPDDIDAETAKLLGQKMQLALRELLNQLNREEQVWVAWVDIAQRQIKTRRDLEYNRNERNSKSLRLAIESAQRGVLPVHTSDSWKNAASSASQAFTTAADYYGASRATDVWRLHLLNLTYLGALTEPGMLQLADYISSQFVVEKERVAFVVIGPNVGLRPTSTALHAERAALQHLHTLLSEPHHNLEIGSVTIPMDHSTRAHAELPLRKDALFIIANDKLDNGKWICKFAKSALYKNEATTEMLPFSLRHRYVNPTRSVVQGVEVTSGHTEAERKQTHSGCGFYSGLLGAVLAGLQQAGLRRSHVLCIREEAGYDSTLAEAAMKLYAAPPARLVVPKMAVSSLLTEGSTTSLNNMEKYHFLQTDAVMKDGIVE